MPTLPGHEILDPNDLEFYLLGRLEGHCKDYRSPIRTDLSRIKQYHRIEAANVAGPYGLHPGRAVNSLGGEGRAHDIGGS